MLLKKIGSILTSAACVWVALHCDQVLASGSVANIVSSRVIGKELFVVAEVPAGTNQVILQTEAAGGAWLPRAVKRVKGNGTKVVFTIQNPRRHQNLRVWVEPQPLPASFYGGRHAFNALSGDSSKLSALAGAEAPSGMTPGSSTAGSGTVAVAEQSDIWEISGNRLFFFNQYRGLQIIDITNPDTPSLLGQLDLPAAGEQMYVLDSSNLVLLAQNCSSDYGQLNVDFVRITENVPTITETFSVTGYLDDSRVVGTALYVSCGTYSNEGTNSYWGTQISSFDCSNPGSPVARTNLWIDGYGNVVAAQGNLLFVINEATNWWQSDVNCIDISAGDGSMNIGGVVHPAGQINDQYAIDLSGEILTTISTTYDDSYWPSATEIQTFSLTNLAMPAPVGTLKMASGEYLSATRFGSNVAYITTSETKNPLYIVDLSNPAAPKVASTLDVPSAESYLYPLGPQLVTIGQGGTTNWQTTVSLFDVSNLSKPALLSQVGVGSSNSWSAASYDPQAFSILPGAGLILIPCQGWWGSGSSSGVQIIDLGATSLVARGVIEQAQTRRVALASNRVISISGEEYLSADISDQDHPAVSGALTLAWPVNSLFVAGGYLLEIGGTNFDEPDSVIRVVTTNAPGVLAAEWTFTNGPIVGTTTQSNLLYVLEATIPEYPLIFDPVAGPVTPLNRNTVARHNRSRAKTRRAAQNRTSNDEPPQTYTYTVTLSVVDLSQLPALTLVGQTSLVTTNLISRQLQALWPKPGVLSWVGLEQSWFWPLMEAPMGGPASPIYPGFWFWNSEGLDIWTYNVANSDLPMFDSVIDVAANGWNDGGVAVATNGLVYLSHSIWHFTTNQNSGDFEWSLASYLDVVDFTDPSLPALRTPVNIAGPLAGVSRDGNIVYAVLNSWSSGQSLEALAYDGISAYQVASLSLGTAWNPNPLVWNETVFAGQSVASDGQTNQLSSWTLSDAAAFEKLASAQLPYAADAIASFGNLLGVQSGDDILLFDASQPRSLQPIGSRMPSGCLWPGLTGADGSASAGLWTPLGDYGTLFVALTP